MEVPTIKFDFGESSETLANDGVAEVSHTPQGVSKKLLRSRNVLKEAQEMSANYNITQLRLKSKVHELQEVSKERDRLEQTLKERKDMTDKVIELEGQIEALKNELNRQIHLTSLLEGDQDAESTGREVTKEDSTEEQPSSSEVVEQVTTHNHSETEEQLRLEAQNWKQKYEEECLRNQLEQKIMAEQVERLVQQSSSTVLLL
ncbi:hypothetical protein HDU76_005542 [Blyttiomyces sp. JEL0837]|nr:hypothetical protein HDU76_005542 [Blyttiomyces sp. JEL0837]